MVKKIMKSDDGKYHIKGKKYDMLIGSRAQVHHGTAYKTPGNLTKSHIMMNKHGRIVSVKKHHTAKREKRLVKAGYVTRKGVFGSVKNQKGMSMKRSGKSKTRGRGKSRARTMRGGRSGEEEENAD
jgi:hypothetical protein